MIHAVRLVSVTLVVALVAATADARNIYVDNQNGSDGNNGSAAEIETRVSGPVQTIRRALKLAVRADTIVLRNTGEPYAEVLNLVGGQHSGFPTEPFTIVGNGAVLSGVATVPSDGWQRQRDGLWRLSLTRKGTYRFFRDGLPVAEHVFASRDWSPAELPLDHWTSHRGAVLFHFDDRQTPITESWTYAAAELGISLVDVRHVRIVDLQIVGFRVDGVNADNNCNDVVLESVMLHNNGHAGLSIGGTSQVSVINSQITDNGRHSILITERGGLRLEDCELNGVEPTVEPVVVP
ncbi:MAG: hypothetical protein B7Z55_06980 [Planctomycetales bacterium 12-60-4]|nr:MAG: hypothetical protein B7Z55_06980 [Planctomycetales bacterium 12-60-4]